MTTNEKVEVELAARRMAEDLAIDMLQQLSIIPVGALRDTCYRFSIFAIDGAPVELLNQTALARYLAARSARDAAVEIAHHLRKMQTDIDRIARDLGDAVDLAES